MHIDEASLLEELMNGISDQRTHTEYSLKRIGTRTQMRHGTQIFQGVALLLHRVIRSGCPLKLHTCSLNLKRLLRIRCRYECAFYDHSCTDVDLADLCKIFQLIRVYDLKGLKKRTVMQYNKTKCLRVTVAANPAADRDFFSDISIGVVVELFYCCEFHCFCSP